MWAGYDRARHSSLESLENGRPHEAGTGHGGGVLCELFVGESGEEAVGDPAVLRPGGVDVRSEVPHSVAVVQLHNQSRAVSESHLEVDDLSGQCSRLRAGGNTPGCLLPDWPH